MANLKLVSFMIAVAAVLVLSIQAYSCPRRGDSCKVLRRCSTARDLAWATDGNSCFVFQNECFLINENCARRKQNKRALKKLPTSCQSLCQDSLCTLEFDPQCAIWADNRNETFSNPCVLQKQICIRADPPEATVAGSCI